MHGMNMNNIVLRHGDRVISIAQHKDELGTVVCSEMLDITDGYDKDPIQFVDSTKSFLNFRDVVELHSALSGVSSSILFISSMFILSPKWSWIVTRIVLINI